MEKSAQLFLAALALAGGLVLSTLLATRALVKVKSQDQTIAVTGSAKRRIRSDLVVWSSELSSRGDRDRAAVYRKLAADMPKVRDYLIKKGIKPDEIKIHSVATTELHPRDKQGNEEADVVSGIVMKQSLEVRSAEVDKVTEVSRQATELLEQGIEIESSAPEYRYTRLGDLKILMLAEAAKDAKLRADQIATSTGSRIGALRSARMGVMQVNAAEDSETSSEGTNDTSSLEKDVMAVVSSSFALE